MLPAGGLGNFDPKVFITHGSGSRVWDQNGTEYVDYLIGSGPMLLGHGHPEVLEAVFEQLELKQQLFEKLDQLCAAQTLLASNTSAISISELAAVTRRAENVLGLHFFSPVPMMQVVEVIKGISTTHTTVEIGRDFVEDVVRKVNALQRVREGATAPPGSIPEAGCL